MMTSPFPRFTGNRPSNASKDAKYGIGMGDSGQLEVGLLYRAADGEKWHATDGRHPELVRMVSAVKSEIGGSDRGPFYINEFGMVIVPAGDDAEYYYAGDYDGELIFQFEGHRLCGDGTDLQGNPLAEGDVWIGPHPGIPYVLSPRKPDVYYEAQVRPRVTKEIWLGDSIGASAAEAFALRVRRIKGHQGGRFYINEWREIFAPREGATGWEYIYIGHLELDEPWFPKPI
jgi:hypothetical protein